MARVKRSWHSDFEEYMKYIVNHKNYKGIVEPIKEDGTIRWVVSGNSPIGKQRDEWWLFKRKELNVINKAEVARKIHPVELNGMKPCQICGKKLSIFYVYPNANTLKLFKKFFKVEYKSFDKTFEEILIEQFQLLGQSIFGIMKGILGIKEKVNDDINSLVLFAKNNCQTKFSPGVMSNPPDRFDGFHTYNACCRSKEDTGRHSGNMATYTQDRRAYEYWSEGDFNIANRLMGEYRKYNIPKKCPKCGILKNMTADHVGPVSLGFRHRPNFNPLCTQCNSSKNNRLTYADVQQLIIEEKQEPIISWHSKYLWDLLKGEVKNDDDAIKLSRLMVTNLQIALNVLSEIHSLTDEKFFHQYLNPSCAFYDYRFEDFDPMDLKKLKTLKVEFDSKNKNKNAERYVRISFESLVEFKKKDNRWVKKFANKDLDDMLPKIISSIKEKDYKKADIDLRRLFSKIANFLAAKF